MRKIIIDLDNKQKINADHNWLDIEKIAVVEVTSEDQSFPIEYALLSDKGNGWRASGRGEQLIRLLFDSPQTLKRIRLEFEDLEIERTQQYVLRWSPDGGQSYQEIIRQQWNFSPEGVTNEVEDYQIELSGVTVFELSINPDISMRNAFATLKMLQIA